MVDAARPHGAISIHALRGEGDQQLTVQEPRERISIHALRGEGDGAVPPYGMETLNFYPRPPWGGRQLNRSVSDIPNIFLSTPSVGRATAQVSTTTTNKGISIHALRGEGDRRPMFRLCP